MIGKLIKGYIDVIVINLLKLSKFLDVMFNSFIKRLPRSYDIKYPKFIMANIKL